MKRLRSIVFWHTVRRLLRRYHTDMFQIQDAYASVIFAGGWAAGMTMPTRKEIKRKYGFFDRWTGQFR